MTVDLINVIFKELLTNYTNLTDNNYFSHDWNAKLKKIQVIYFCYRFFFITKYQSAA